MLMIQSLLAASRLRRPIKSITNLTCKKCLIQYFVKTVDGFRSRWNNYKNNYRNYDCSQPCMKRHLYEH